MSNKPYSKSSAEMTPEFLKTLYAMGENKISVEEAFSITVFSETFERIMVRVDSESADTDFGNAAISKKRSSKINSIVRGFDPWV
ncbi:MAG: hypothetical protein GQ535_13090 [Rhodobacteraceae bacterium]|nr:hypothetical protein [Paracoccaceae bacterium]